MTARPADTIDETVVAPDFAQLAPDAVERMAAAAQDVLEIAGLLAKTGDNVVGETIKHAGTFYEWTHYPDGDVYDGETGGQFFYHAHPADLRVGEHGHFHTFLRPAGMPADMAPAPVADYVAPKEANDALSHIVGIAMDGTGQPICLFTTNRWVTGEAWYGAADVVRMLDRFAIGHTQPSWPVNRWITGMVRMFRPQIVALVHARDERIAAWERAGKTTGGNVFEDRKLEITSFCRISPVDQARAIEAAQK